MICTQDLWAIKSMLEDFKDYCTYEEAVVNLINEVEKEIDERDNIQKTGRYRKALEEIEEYIYTDCEYNDGCDRNICIRCDYSNVHDKRILDIINKAKGEGKCQ